MNKFLLFALLLIGVKFCFAQQDKMFTQYLNYPSAINPAYAGSRGTTHILGIARRQWVGLDGAPESAVLSVNSPIPFFNLGMGLILETDKLGPERNTDIALDLSYKLQLSKALYLNLGLKTDLSYYKVDLQKIKVVDQNDPLLLANKNGELIPNFGVGAYLYSNKFFAGLSIPRILQTNVDGGDLAESSLDHTKLHYFLIAGYLTKLNSSIKLKPTILLKTTQGARLSWDLSLMGIFLDRFLFGVSYRNEDAIALIAQVNINKQLRLGYSYDFTYSRLSGRSDGSHEVTFSYDIDFLSKKPNSPRYF